MNRNKTKLIPELLEKNHKDSGEVIAWYSLNGHYTQASLKITTIRKFKKDFTVTPDEKSSFYFAQIVSGSETVNLYFPSLSMVCSCKIKKVEESKKMLLEFPQNAQFIDRRESSRHQSKQELLVTLENKGLKETRNCFDLSAGGFSVFYPKNSRHKINALKEPIKVILRARSEKIELQCEVVNIDKIKPFKNDNMYYGGTRVSYQFLDMKKIDTATLEEFIEKTIPSQKSN